MSQIREQIDLLVDGELSNEQRRQLLRELEREEGGWRACALAFLEAQAWSGAWQGLVDESTRQSTGSEENMSSVPVETPGVTADEQSGRWAPWFVVAAAVLLSFLGGTLFRFSASPTSVPLTNGEMGLVVQGENEIPGERPEEQLAGRAMGAGDGDKEVMTIWATDRAGKRQQLNVPLVDAKQLEREFGLQFRSGIPEELRDRLQEQGFAVNSRQYFAPLWVGEDRPLVVPVEDTQIIPVSRQIW